MFLFLGFWSPKLAMEVENLETWKFRLFWRLKDTSWWVFVGREMFMAFKIKMEGIEGVREGSMVRDTGWRGWVLVPNEGELENRKNMRNLSDGGQEITC